MKGLGSGIKEFKNAAKEESSSDKDETENEKNKKKVPSRFKMRRNFFIICRCTVLNEHLRFFTAFSLTCLLRNKALKPDCVTDYYNFFCNGYYTNFVSLKQSHPCFLICLRLLQQEKR
jgi:hypothetical protein